MRAAIFLIIKIAVSALLLYLALRLVDFEHLKERFARADPAWLALGFVVLLLVGLSWRRLVILRRWPLTRHLAAAAEIAVAILRSPRLSVAVFVPSILVHVLTGVAAWCAARAIGFEISLASLLFLVPPLMLIAVVPISIAGWGVRESAMIAAFAYAGLPQSDGLALSLLFGVGNLTLGIIGGLIWVVFTHKADRHADRRKSDA